MKYLIVGLGNIGSQYELTRHNIGFLALDRLADKNNLTFNTGRFSDKTTLKYKGRQIHLIKPNTYMNASGKAIKYWLQELKISKENLLVVVDDFALPFGNLRLRQKGSHAGHNGLLSIEDNLDCSTYPRLRLGIGDNFNNGMQVEFLLSRFEDSELQKMTSSLDKACEVILSFCSIGIERTMNQYN